MIAEASEEVTRLAKKLAAECTDKKMRTVSHWTSLWPFIPDTCLKFFFISKKIGNQELIQSNPTFDLDGNILK